MNRITKVGIAIVATLALGAVGIGVAAAQTGGTTTPAPTADGATAVTQAPATAVPTDDSGTQVSPTPGADTGTGHKCPKTGGTGDGTDSSVTPSTSTTSANLA